MRVLLLCKIFFIKYLKIKYFLLTLQQTRAIIKYYNRLYKTKVEWEGKMQERFKIFTVLIANINREIRRVKTEIMANHNLKCPHVSTIYYLLCMGVKGIMDSDYKIFCIVFDTSNYFTIHMDTYTFPLWI